MNKLIYFINSLDSKKFLFFLIIVFLIELVGLFFLYKKKDENNYFSSLKGDPITYNQLAENLAKGKGYSILVDDEYKPTFQYQIGYPLFLSFLKKIFGKSLKPIIIIQSFIFSLSFILVLSLIRKQTKNNFSMLLFSLFIFSEHKLFNYSFLLLSEIFSIFLIVLSIYFFHKYMKTGKNMFSVLCGLVFGFLILTRPVFQLFPIVILTLGLIISIIKKHKKMLIPILLYFISSVIVFVPYIYRNKLLFDVASLSSIGGPALYSGTNLKYNGEWLGWEKIQKDLNIAGNTPFRIISTDKEMAKEMYEKTMAAAKNNITNSPIQFVKLYTKNLKKLVLPNASKYPLLNILQTIIRVFAMILFILSICNIFNAQKISLHYIYFTSMLLLLAFYYWGIHGFFNSPGLRYGLPLLVLIYFFASHTASNNNIMSKLGRYLQINK